MDFINAFTVSLQAVVDGSGFVGMTSGNVIMIIVGLVLLYLAFARDFEPLLLSPIAFGCILANIPFNGFEEPGVMSAIGLGIKYEIFPPLIFLGVGAMTDFGPLIARPSALLMGAAAQIGVFVALLGAMLLGFNAQEAGSIGIIGGADGPTSIYLATKMAPHLLGAIAVAAYTYMALVPLIQPPVMNLLTSKKEREVIMEQAREVTKFERIAFPIVSTIFISLLLPSITALLGMLMLGNLFRESGVTDRLSDTAQNALINTVTIFLALGTGLTMSAESFLVTETLLIICLGLHLRHGRRCCPRQDHVPRDGLEDQPAHRFCGRFRCSDGCARQPDRRHQGKAGQLSPHACHGAERCRCYRHCRCGRHDARDAHVIRRTAAFDKILLPMYYEGGFFLWSRSVLPPERGRHLF